jgi:hypothetical protein
MIQALVHLLPEFRANLCLLRRVSEEDEKELVERVFDLLPHLVEDFWALAKLALLVFGVREVLPILSVLGTEVRRNPGRGADVVLDVLCGLLQLRNDLDGGRAVPNNSYGFV